MFQFRLICAFVLLFGAAWGDAPESRVTFTLGGSAIAFPMPAGYCQANGRYAEIGRTLAALDKQNRTEVFFADCGDMAKGADMTSWGTLKAPTQTAEGGAGSRRRVIARFAAQIDPDALAALNRDAETQTGKAYRQELGANANLDVAFKPLAADDDAAYLGGTLDWKDQLGNAIPVAAAFSVTVVHDRIFFLYFFTLQKSPQDILAMLEKAKSATHAFVDANGG